MEFNPHGLIEQYGLDLAACLINRCSPDRLYVQTENLAIARAVARRFVGCLEEILVDRREIASSIREDYHLPATVYDDSLVDAAIIPFSRQARETPPPAKSMVLLAENSLSYKSLLRPGRVHDSATETRAWLEQRFSDIEVWGLLDPVFVARLALSRLAGHRLPEIHFRVGQQALDDIYVTGYRALISYIVVLSGTLNEAVK